MQLPKLVCLYVLTTNMCNGNKQEKFRSLIISIRPVFMRRLSQFWGNASFLIIRNELHIWWQFVLVLFEPLGYRMNGPWIWFFFCQEDPQRVLHCADPIEFDIRNVSAYRLNASFEYLRMK